MNNEKFLNFAKMFLKALPAVVAVYDHTPTFARESLLSAREKQRDDVSNIFPSEDQWKICHSYSGCSFIWNLRVAYFRVKPSYLVINRGYYMAVRRYGFYLRVLIISPSGHVAFFLLYKIFITVKRN